MGRRTKNVNIALTLFIAAIVVFILYINQHILREIEEAPRALEQSPISSPVRLQHVEKNRRRPLLEESVSGQMTAEDGDAAAAEEKPEKKRQRITYEMPVNDDILLQ